LPNGHARGNYALIILGRFRRVPPMSATRYFSLPEAFVLDNGVHLHGAQLAFETWGELNAQRDNAVLILTGMSPSAHASSSSADPSVGWWQAMIGPGQAIDTHRWFVVCANNLGSCRGSTGPASLDPATGSAYRLNFPRLSLEDIARAKLALLDHLGIARLHALVAPSMGGMTAQALLAQSNDRCARAALISTATAATPFALALRSLQRDIVMADPGFAQGHYQHPADAASGMGLARKLGVITYRSADEWQTRFGRTRQHSEQPPVVAGFSHEFAVEHYLQGHADRWAGSFDPTSYLYLSRAMDEFDLRRHGDQATVLRRSGLQQALVIGVATDLLFPIGQQAELAQLLERAEVPVHYAALPSIQGHDSFLVDIERFAPLIAELLDSPSAHSRRTP
jgi:homoserine O-acetyltransferase